MRRDGSIPPFGKALAMLAVTLLACAVASGRELSFYGGLNDVQKNGRIEGGIEFRWRSFDYGLVPVVGGARTEDEASWIYAGLQRPFRLGEAWLLTPGFAVALFEAGQELDLGGPLEFRSSLELSRSLGRGRRLGLAAHHMSNGSFRDKNPGSDSVLVTFVLPLGRR